MSLAIISTTADKPFLIPKNEAVRGYGAFACIYDGDTWNVSWEHFKQIEEITQMIIFIPSSQPERIEGMIEIAKRFNGIKLVQDSDPPTGWFTWHPLVTQKTVELFNCCDAVIVHDSRMIDLVSTFTQLETSNSGMTSNTRSLTGLTPTPVFYLPEPSFLASYSQINNPLTQSPLPKGGRGVVSKGEKERFRILLPITHCAGYNSPRNAIVNYAIAKRIEDLGKLTLIANVIEANAGNLSLHEEQLLATLNLRVDFIKPKNRQEMFALYNETKLMINMDSSNCVGHWLIDAAAMGIPTICSRFPDAHCLFDELAFYPYNVNETVNLAKQLLLDEDFWKTVSQDVQERAKEIYSFAAVKKKFEGILSQIGDKKSLMPSKSLADILPTIRTPKFVQNGLIMQIIDYQYYPEIEEMKNLEGENFGTNFLPSKHWEYPFLYRHSCLKTNAKILNVGDDAGVLQLWLTNKGYQVYACAVEEGSINLINNLNQVNIQFLPFEKLPDNFFDAVFGISFNLETNIKELWRVTKVGGKICLSLNYEGDGGRAKTDIVTKILQPLGFDCQPPEPVELDFIASQGKLGTRYTILSIILEKMSCPKHNRLCFGQK